MKNVEKQIEKLMKVEPTREAGEMLWQFLEFYYATKNVFKWVIDLLEKAEEQDVVVKFDEVLTKLQEMGGEETDGNS